MANVKHIPKVKLIVGIMYCSQEILEHVLARLEKKFGKHVDKIIYPFNFTDYYSDEMGDGLLKMLLVFKRTIDRKSLPSIKLFTNSLEKKLSADGKRRVNLDPGYMTLHNVVLASAKELPHRVYLGKGIFADVVLNFKHGAFHHSDHTFPDYKSDLVKRFLVKNRK